MQNAISNGNLSEVKSLVNSGQSPNEIPNTDWTPLCFATYYGQPSIVQYLLQAGADVNKPLNMGATPLFIACEHQKMDCLRILVEEFKGDPNIVCPGSGTGPFLKACESGNMEIVQYMVNDAKCDINLAQNDGATPFFLACQGNKIEVVKFLIGAGVDVNKGKRDSATPLIVAAELGHTEVVRAICKAPNETTSDLAMYNGVTPLYKACEHGHYEIVKILVNDANVDYDKPKNDGVSPLFTACQMNHLDIIKFLAEKGADINKAKNDGVVPIYMAAEYRNIAVVEYLISRGADLDRASINGLTPLHAASIQHVPETVRLLCDAGANKEAKDRGGFTPICNASEWGREPVVSVLLEKGADPNAAGWNGNSPIHVAAWKGHDKVVNKFISCGSVNVNRQNHYGFTPLHLAALGKHYYVVQPLLQAGADVNIQDNDGNTPLHMAIDGGDESVCRLLYDQPGVELGKQNLLGFNPVMYAMSRHPERVASLVGSQYSNYIGELPVVIPAGKFTSVASRVLPPVSLENVKLIPYRYILEAGEFPHYSRCEENGWHTDARSVKLSDRVLFISHRWGSIEHPDPTKEQYSILKNFLDKQGAAFDYVWLDYACICQDRESELFGFHLTNIPTAVWVSTDCLIIPKLIPSPYNNNPDTIVPTTHLTDYLGRAWCILEGMACMLTGTTLYCAFQVGEDIRQEKFDRPEGAASHLGFFMSYVKVWNALFAVKQNDMMNVNLNVLEEQWRAIEPCQILGLLIKISSSQDAETEQFLQKALDMSMQFEDFQNCQIPDIRELWGLMGNCAFEEDKIIVLKLMLFIGYYSMNLLSAAGREELQNEAKAIYDASSESKICSIM
mmetsp:Transcript_26130/g.33884  ORF Transcript_26130/g.33884 Transcript_26130/m.33884 type:complete len:846 (+) Transcript_26130:179-2716(+)